MNFLDVFILSIVEGVTEFLPISSTGHLILAGEILRIPETDFVKSFSIAIQLGAILSVFLFVKKWNVANASSVKRIAVAFLPSAVVGLLLYKFIKAYLLGNEMIVLVSLFIGGIVMILVELLLRDKEGKDVEIKSLSYGKAFGVGLFQAISIVPGVSRAAATIIGGRIAGLSRKTALEFSFVLAIPTMLAATGLDLLKSGWNFTSEEFGLLFMGFILSFLIAALSIKFLLSFVKNHTFISFGAYRILLAILFWIVIL